MWIKKGGTGQNEGFEGRGVGREEGKRVVGDVGTMRKRDSRERRTDGFEERDGALISNTHTAGQVEVGELWGCGGEGGGDLLE